MESLKNVLAEIQEEEKEIQSKPFEVTDQETATEALRRITYFQEQMKDVDNTVENQTALFRSHINKIEKWGEEAKGEHQERINFYSHLLEGYIRAQVEEREAQGKKAKRSLKLPYGSIRLKKQQPQFKKDEEQLLQYAKTNGLVKVKETVDWETIKKQSTVVDGKLVSEDGEVILGVSVEERSDKFEVNIEG